MPAGQETTQERDGKAIALAEARGRRQQEVDGRLDAHDQRFERLNGSIDRSARAQESLVKEVAAVKKALAEVVAKQDTAAAVSAALGKAAVSRREFWLGVAAVVAVLAAALIQGRV